MKQRKRPADLQGLLDELAELGQSEHITVKRLLEAIGRRSFAPLLLLLASLLGFTPLGMIPTVPTVLAVFIILRRDQPAGVSPAAVSSAITTMVPSSARPAATRPQASAPCFDEAGGSTATTMR